MLLDQKLYASPKSAVSETQWGLHAWGEQKANKPSQKSFLSPPPPPLRYLTLSYGGFHTSEEEITTQKWSTERLAWLELSLKAWVFMRIKSDPHTKILK